VLTASHVGPGTFNLDGNSYLAVANSSHRLLTDDNPNMPSDLVMFQLQSSPAGLSPVNLIGSTQALFTTTQLSAMGYGRNRAADQTWWDADWVEVSQSDPNAEYTGFKWSAGTTKRWGTNLLDHTTLLDDGYGRTRSLVTVFDANDNFDEMQAASGDSGGGAFVNIGGIWKLAGITLAIGGPSNEPGQTAVFGDSTYFADLRSYANQINLIMVPEPGTLLLVVSGSVVAIGIWLFRRRTAAR
jgi:hypothetical protein